MQLSLGISNIALCFYPETERIISPTNTTVEILDPENDHDYDQKTRPNKNSLPKSTRASLMTTSGQGRCFTPHLNNGTAASHCPLNISLEHCFIPDPEGRVLLKLPAPLPSASGLSSPAFNEGLTHGHWNHCWSFHYAP